MLSKEEKRALVANLPDNWKATAAEKFQKSTSYVEKVAYGSIENLEVFEHLVSIAEANKLNQANKMVELKERITNLAKPISA
ncbi:hypothetical protein J3L18_05510 [Mucilaginibacter gossypii]|uniref:hypothetical protein n=1 Tax=Mucilaginibacter gossypii TaxID=551996 RepID=UPI000DCC04D6|nr:MULTISPECIES: hypothetical protein [Mucilaginibacter]QTE38535.1 hypothetical protein J3L18_05510 [Mucilaginibacter gossypii]RAV55731.1 hypothetical protein DIU36_16705 [Mucilaginibacter rubeus]